MSRELSARLALFARLNPKIYDVIPRGPQWRLDAVALNPQPLPPKERATEAVVMATAQTAMDIANAAVTASALGLDHRSVIGEALVGWCGNEPRVFPWPVKWPWWWPWPEPDPEPWYRVEDIRATAAVVFVEFAERLHPENEVRPTLLDAAQQLGKAAGL